MAIIEIDMETLGTNVPIDIREVCEGQNLRLDQVMFGSVSVSSMDNTVTNEDHVLACKAVMQHYGWTGAIDHNGCCYFVGGNWQERANDAYQRAVQRARYRYPQATI